jgi:hypothetical protein
VVPLIWRPVTSVGTSRDEEPVNAEDTMDIDRGHTWLEHLRDDECWRLLEDAPVGRVGVLVNSAPEIYPVNHLVDEGTILFRTDPGTKLAGLARSPAACFQVDGVDTQQHTGWSVLVKGRAEQVHDPDERRRLDQLPLRPWSVGTKWFWIRLTPDEVTGRRIWRSAPDVDAIHSCG